MTIGNKIMAIGNKIMTIGNKIMAIGNKTMAIGNKIVAIGIRLCSEAVLLRSTVNAYFLLRPVFTMLYPDSNYFRPQFTKRDSWLLRIPLNRLMTPH